MMDDALEDPVLSFGSACTRFRAAPAKCGVVLQTDKPVAKYGPGIMAHLLLVSNDPDDAAALAWGLRELGHTVHVEASARAALACLEHEDIEVVVCDEVIPGMLAVDLVATGRERLGRPHLPAVILSELPAALRADLPVPEHVTVVSARAKSGQVAHAISRLSLPERQPGSTGATQPSHPWR